MPQSTRPKPPLASANRTNNGPAFVFVDNPGGSLTGPGKGNTKTIIRRQAARSAYIRYQENWARQVAVTAPSDSETNTTQAISGPVSPPEPIPPSLPGEYETFRSSFNFDITDLTSFTDVDLATSAYRLLQDESSHVLVGQPDTTRLAFHNRGGIRLLKLRKPASYTSEFDWMLLKNQGPSTIIGEMSRNERSMFEAPEWQNVFQHASDLQSDTDCRFWWRFFAITCCMPGIVKDTRDLLNDTPNLSEYSTRSLLIRERAQEILKSLHENHVVYQQAPPHPQSLFTCPVAVESPDRIRLRGFFLYTIMYICRVLATVCPTEMERATSEVEAQTFASQAIVIEEVAAKVDRDMSWQMRQRNDLARSIIRGREEWLSVAEHGISWNDLKDRFRQRWMKWESSYAEGCGFGEGT
ncbi:hypothetical protein FLONG3_1124 [Fusarium longipes]|uniref:Transcription factor domain-containing protein n=1 Tax=Fusarium longipes TaxID=694270 RepID=A0A395T7S1_9HYPO|nr:hypothetical protein FLONG3_1124 [Fusarium longipes]